MADPAYLRKYLSSSLDGGKKKKKKKKKSQEKSGFRIVEMNDDDWGHVDKSDDEDAPQIVFTASKEEPTRRQKGTWSEVANDEMRDSEDDLSPLRRGRVDSDGDLSPPRKGRVDSDGDLSPPRKGRVDSDDGDHSPPRKGRVDSDGDISPPRNGRVDSDGDLSPPRKGRVDSDGDISPPRKGQRIDSDDEDVSAGREVVADDGALAKSDSTRRGKNNGIDAFDVSGGRRRVKEGSEEKEPTKMVSSSGHVAGLIRGFEFRDAEARLKAERDAKLKDEAGTKPAVETVYRDQSGRKLDMATEYARIQAELENKKREEREEYEWGRGTKQKKDEESALRELEEMKNEPFARAVDDPRLERERREAIRDGDPMAQYLASTRKKREEKSSDGRPVYKGPNTTSNRFGIRPGYRWDGIDRTNGWEAKLLSKRAEAIGRKEDRYAWSSADM